MRNCTKYINEYLPKEFSSDPQIIKWMQSYLQSSWADQNNGYLHYEGKVYKVHIWFGRIHAVDYFHGLIASVSIKGFKKYVRRLTQYQSQWQ